MREGWYIHHYPDGSSNREYFRRNSWRAGEQPYQGVRHVTTGQPMCEAPGHRYEYNGPYVATDPLLPRHGPRR